jgi:hypothetical protein
LGGDARDIRPGNYPPSQGRHEDAPGLAESVGAANLGALLIKFDALVALERTHSDGKLALATL